ncbi:hypothetical protein ACWD1Z_25925 [Streptomyces sp. NPDC002784]
MAQNGTAGSRFENAVAVRHLALSGHSMGAGAAVLAAQRNPAVSSVSLLAAAETNPSAVAAAAQLTLPPQFLAGSRDTVTPPEQTWHEQVWGQAAQTLPGVDHEARR